MFIRWQRRARRSPKYGMWSDGRGDSGEYIRVRKSTKTQDFHWRAIAVESVRVDGKPRQRHVAYLGGITESGMAILNQRRYFWNDVDKRLDQLSDRIAPGEREKLEAAIEKKIPRLTDGEVEEARRRREAAFSIFTRT